jgi:hypothetical protein
MLSLSLFSLSAHDGDDLLDIRDPTERHTAGDFYRLARQATAV